MNPFRVLFLVSLILGSIFLIEAAHAFLVYLRPPKMIFYVNVTREEPAIVESFLEVRNDNNVSMLVGFTPSEDIENITRIEENVTLEPNETRRVNFTVEMTEPKTYRGKIIVMYSIGSSAGIALQADIIIYAEGEITETTVPIDTNPLTGRVIFGLSWLQLGLIFMAVIILLTIGLVRLRKK